MKTHDTIYALSSGSLPAGIAVIRLSGKSVEPILLGIAGSVPEERMGRVRLLKDPGSGEVLDKALVIFMPGPHSVTGEDVGELHCHGSRAVVARLLEILSAFPETRLAEPGEFSRRAFHNQRMDLVEAEGLADLLLAETEGQRRLATYHFMGNASSVYDSWRKTIIEILSRVEAAIDFSDEEDVALSAMADFKEKVGGLSQSLKAAYSQGQQAQALRDGVSIVIAGPPNAGKSSLLNHLAAREAAIVSSIAGTTRDAIEVKLNIAGVPVILTDTAGLRENSSDQIELLGMAKSRQAMAEADLVVWLSDASGEIEAPEIKSPCLFVVNKIDLLPSDSILTRNEQRFLAVSVKTGQGLDLLIEQMTDFLRSQYLSSDHAVVVRARHQQALREIVGLLDESLNIPFDQVELIAEKLRKASFTLGRITGRIDVEDLLGNIFSEFCIGK